MEKYQKSYALTVPQNNSGKKNNNAAANRPISHIFAQTNIKQNNLEYQQLLIKNKQLELKVDQLRVELQHLNKQRKKANQIVQEVQQRKETAKAGLKEKQCYLQRYYDQLDRKFRGGRDDLFAGLKKLELNLLEMYQRDQRRIKESLQPEREELARIQKIVAIQRQQRDELVQQINAIQKMKNIDIEARPANQKEQLQAENKFIRSENERLTKEKKILENEQKILKKILNIEQQHRKHGSVIAAGIKKMFGIKVKEQRYKQAVSKEYAKNIPGLKQIMSKRSNQLRNLQAQYEEKNKKLIQLKQQNALRAQQYAALEDQLYRQNMN